MIAVSGGIDKARAASRADAGGLRTLPACMKAGKTQSDFWFSDFPDRTSLAAETSLYGRVKEIFEEVVPF